MRSAHRRPGRLATAALLLAASGAGPAFAQETAEVRPVTGFEVERYLGLWHEIAAMPNRFQADCVADTTATYSRADDMEGIQVVNSCLEADGARDMAEGRARFTGASDEGALEVTFVSLLGAWLWPLSGDYVVIALDPEYRWAAVGHPTREYGWILAREARLAPDVLSAVRGHFEAAGYDACDLLMSPNQAGDPRTPLCEMP